MKELLLVVGVVPLLAIVLSTVPVALQRHFEIVEAKAVYESNQEVLKNLADREDYDANTREMVTGN